MHYISHYKKNIAQTRLATLNARVSYTLSALTLLFIALAWLYIIIKITS
jgi:hypothetical protein